MEIRNHRIDQIWHANSSNLSSGTINPRFIVNHYTAGWNGKGARDWLMGAAGGTSNRNSSAHVVIDLDGTAWQIAAFNRRAWHAGPSKYGTVDGLNSHSIGLEFTNPGFMKNDGAGNWVDSAGNRRTEAQLNEHGGFILAKHQIVGSGTYAWPVYTEAQLATGREITMAILNKYDIADIITHEEIDKRGWKTDPGPAFPQDAFKALMGEETDSFHADNGPAQYRVNATRLNFRGGPDTSFDTIDPPKQLVAGTIVVVEQATGDWAYVTIHDGMDGFAGTKGWVSRRYIDRVF